ncbi:hypothetical protein [Actinacidiphila acidipaludis]|uniref:Uncharacterized protein n=1 Tax=Actinacidiphila acidipaludis TaxID=2873382 RepID=A0ABS7QGK9_9ACTN|nr:hypothetical protein [Streptomyces acidipaludis]MBY8882311.1 hypothetical protein [Streptomyces acidipaludis]
MTTAPQRSRQTAKRAAKTTAKSPKSAARGRASGTTTTRSTKGQGKAASGAAHHDHDVTITIPVDSAASAVGKVVSLPVVAAQRILPSAGGLPLYVGLGALGIAGVLEWPVAAGIGVGYAVLRHGGPLNPRHEDKAGE